MWNFSAIKIIKGMKVRKYLLLGFFVVLAGCTTAKMELGDLPQPVYVSASDGTTYMAPSSDVPPANALSYAQLDTLVRNTTGSTYSPTAIYKNYAISYAAGYLAFSRSWNNFFIRPGDSDYFEEIMYAGDRSVENEYGFAEQSTGAIANTHSGPYFLGFANTKMVLGGGMTGLNYVDFGYWIGVPKDNSKRVLYTAFATHPYFTTYAPNASTSYTGKAAAVAYDNNVPGSARELGGNATLTLNASKNTHLNLAFQNYYTFDIYATNQNGSSITSVAVNGTNTNGGPAFSSCSSSCPATANYFYTGQYDAAEVGGTYSYTSGNSNLVGSFGASLD